jgi:parallel beta-helix repeat protein
MEKKRLLLLLILILTISIMVYAGPGPPPTVFTTNWYEMRGGTDNAGVADAVGPAGIPIITCNTSIASANFTTTPVAFNDVVAIGDSGNGQMHFFNTTNCTLLKSYTVGADILSTPTMTDTIVYFGSADGRVYALDYTTNPNPTHIWNYSTGDSIRASPTLDRTNSILYIGSDDNQVYALNPANGALIWNYSTGDKVRSKGALISTPSGPNLLIGSDDANLYILNGSNGISILSAIPFGAPIRGAIAVRSAMVLLKEGNFIHALNSATGFAEIWNNTDGSPVVGLPVSNLGMVVYGTSKKKLFSLSLPVGGAPIWVGNLGANKPKSPVATQNGTTFFTSSSNTNMVLAYSNTGVEIWNLTLVDVPVDSGLAVHGDALFIGDEGGMFYKISPPPPEPCTTPSDDLYINEDTTICTGTHAITDVSNDGVIITNTSDVVITCQAGTTITGPGTGRGINISHSNVTITGCTIGSYASTIQNFGSSSGITLYDNTILAASVSLIGNNHNITGNNILCALLLGNDITGSNNTLVELNTINSNFAINAPTADKSTNLTIRSNTLTGNMVPLSIQDAQNSLIANNHIKPADNSVPLEMQNTTSGFTIYNNNFTSSSPVVDNGTSNNWQLSYEESINIIGGSHMGGNYYSIYTGLDNGSGLAPNHNTSGDGIGDALNYTISGSAGSIDTLPLTNNLVECVDNDFDTYYADCKAGACCAGTNEDCDDTNPSIIPLTQGSFNSDVTFCTRTYNIVTGGTVISATNKNIVIDCNGAEIIGSGTGYGFRINGFDNVTLKNCHFMNYSYLADIRNSVGLNISNVNFTNTSNNGMWISNVNSSTFDSMHFVGANYALSIVDMHNNYITNNIFENNSEGQNILSGGDGGEFGNLTGNVISNNIFRNNPGAGIGWFNMIGGNTISDNTFIDIQGTPISFENVNHTIISGNTIYGEGSESSEFMSCNNLTIANNIIIDSDGKGIDLDTSHNFTISGNTILNIQSDNAINLIDSYDNNITRNNVTNCSSASSAYVTTVTPRSYNGGKYKNCIGAGGECIYFQYGSTVSDINQIDGDGDPIGVSGTENYTLCLVEDNLVGANSTWFVSADDFADCNTWYTNIYIPAVGTATVAYEEFNVLAANGAGSDYTVSYNASTTPVGGFTAPHLVVYYTNAVYGIGLDSSCNNYIYDNYLANTYNADDDADGSTCINYWNMSKKPGINIVGGPNLGGNFYSDYTGIDGDGDWLGDTPYDGIGDINDSLPLIAFNNTFSFSGNTYDAIGTILGDCTISMEVWRFSPTLERIMTYSTTSNATGFFNLTGISGFNGPYGYKPIVTHTNANGTTDYVGKSLPEFPYQMIAGLPNFNFYLDEAGTINITAVNATGSPVTFYYSIKDTNLGFPVKEEWTTMTANAIEYVSLDRNYSVVIYPNMSFPLNSEINNLTDYDGDKINLEFNTSQNFVWVSGYVKNQNNNSNFTNLSIISYIAEPGNVIFSESAFPYNMSEWRWDGSYDDINATTGFYNITLMGNNNGMDVLMFVIARNSSNDGSTYIQYSNVTLTDTDITNNITVRPAAGSFNKTITINNGGMGGEVSFTTLATNFSIINSTNDSISTSAFLDLTIDYTDVGGAAFHWMENVDATESGIFSVTLLADHNVDSIEVYTESAPVKTSLSTTEVNNGTTNPPIYITVKTFDPGGIDGEFDDDDIEMRMFKSNAACSVPVPDDEDCTKGDSQTKEHFDPMIMTLGGGKVDFGMKMLSTGIEVRYIDVDLLASGPPDAMFDSAADTSTSGGTIEDVWRFGSLGPEIYSWVMIGVPYDPSTIVEDDDITITIDYLYDEDWNAVWTLGVDDLVDVPSDYLAYTVAPYVDYINGNGIECDEDDDTLATGLCYKDTTNNNLWFKIPHFSGVGPSVSGTSSSSGSTSSGGGVDSDCADGQDNDRDGYIDYPYDLGCNDYDDDNEENCWSEWECGSWPLCTEDGYVLRECEDLNSCSPSTQDPILSKSCVYLPPEGEPVEEVEEETEEDEEEESGMQTVTGAAVTEAVEESTGNIFKWYGKVLLLAGLTIMVIFLYAVFKGGGGKDVLNLFNSKEGSHNSKKTTKMMSNYIKKRSKRK